MATITITSDTIHVELTRLEQVFGLRRGGIRLPLRAVRHVSVEQAPLGAARGIRAPGLAVPLLRKIGTWRRPGSRAFVSVRRSTPAAHVRLAGADLDALLVSTPDAEAIAAAIARSAEETRRA